MRLSDHAVSVMGYHAEAVGEGFGDGLPLPWQGLVEKAENRLGELPQVGMEPVTPHVAVHYPPQTPGRVQVRGGGGDLVQTEPDGAPGP